MMNDNDKKFVMEGNNYNQRMVIQLATDACHTLIGQGHSGMESKIIVVIKNE